VATVATVATDNFLYSILDSCVLRGGHSGHSGHSGHKTFPLQSFLQITRYLRSVNTFFLKTHKPLLFLLLNMFIS
jgi:hypothetical protein